MTKKTRTATKVSHTARYEELRHILEDRRREIVSEVNSKMKDVRVEGAGGIMQPVEMGDISDATIQDDIDFALIQMKAETLQRIDEALRRLEDGTYGNCFECADEISQQRRLQLQRQVFDLVEQQRPAISQLELAGLAAGASILLMT